MKNKTLFYKKDQRKIIFLFLVNRTRGSIIYTPSDLDYKQKKLKYSDLKYKHKS